MDNASTQAEDAIREDIVYAIRRAENEDEFGLADSVMAALNRVPVTVTLALVSRVHALEEALRRLADAAYPVADHERAYGPSTAEVVLEARRIGLDDGVHRMTVGHLRELGQAIEQAEEAFWPANAIDVAPELLDAR